MKTRTLSNLVVLVALFVVVLYATVYAAPYGRSCQSCLESGTDPWVCYLTYGVGCL